MPQSYLRHPQLAGRVVDGLAFVVTAQDNKLSTLNAAATLIWEQLTQPRSCDELAAALSAKFEVSLEEAKLDVQECLDDLVERQILKIDKVSDKA